MHSDLKEIENYISELEKERAVENHMIEALNLAFNFIEEEQAEKAIETLKNDVIPPLEEIVEKYEQKSVKNEDLIEFHEMVVKSFTLQLERMVALTETFEIILQDYEEENFESLNFKDQLDRIYENNEEDYQVLGQMNDKIMYMSEEYRGIEIDEKDFEEAQTAADPEVMNETYTLIIFQFLFAVVGDDIDLDDLARGIDLGEENNNENETDESANNTKGQENVESIDIESLLKDRGHPIVVFDAEVSIEDTFAIRGRTNLPEDARISLSSKIYGRTNPYLKDELTVDAEGNFGVEFDLDEDILTGDPMLLHLSFMPGENYVDMYGEFGELLEGPFASKYASIKRTRLGATTQALITLEKGIKEKFTVREPDLPSDHGELDIWMEVDRFEIHDQFYDIIVKSNLISLVDTRIEIEVPAYRVAGYVGLGTTRDDGSFRIQVPRLDKELEEQDEVIFIVEAFANSTIESEELYGTYGDKFEGDLAVETNRGKKIVYKFNLHDVK